MMVRDTVIPTPGTLLRTSLRSAWLPMNAGQICVVTSVRHLRGDPPDVVRIGIWLANGNAYRDLPWRIHDGIGDDMHDNILEVI